MALYDIIEFHYALCSWPAHPVCRRELLTPADSSRVGLERHKRWMESSFHPNHWVLHTPANLCRWLQSGTDGTVTSKVSHSFTFFFLFSGKVSTKPHTYDGESCPACSLMTFIFSKNVSKHFAVEADGFFFLFLRCRGALGFFACRSSFAQLCQRPSAWSLR